MDASEFDLSGLTVRQKTFAEKFLAGASATDAARQAGFANPKQYGYRLQRHPLVQAAIRGRLAELKLSADAVLAQTSDIARNPTQDYASVVDGRLVYDLEAMIADGYGHCIKGVKETRYGQVVEFYPADAAQERLLRHHGLLNDKLTVNADEDELDAAIERGLESLAGREETGVPPTDRNPAEE